MPNSQQPMASQPLGTANSQLLEDGLRCPGDQPTRRLRKGRSCRGAPAHLVATKQGQHAGVVVAKAVMVGVAVAAVSQQAASSTQQAVSSKQQFSLL